MTGFHCVLTTEVTDNLFVQKRSWSARKKFLFKGLLRALNSLLLDL